MKITKKDLNRIEEEIRNENKDAKRVTFLKATHNRYSKKLGIAPKYSW